MRPPLGPSVISVGTRSVFDETKTAVGSPRRRRPMVVFSVVVALAIGGVAVMLLQDRNQSTLPSAGPVPVPTLIPTTTTLIPTTSLLPLETTTLPPFGLVTLAENGLLLRATTETQMLLGFGSDPNAVVDTLVGVLGDLTSDTGWVVDEACDSQIVRRVWFGDLEVVFTGDGLADSTDAIDRFAQWFVEGADASESTLWTLNRIGIGSTVMDLTDAHPDELTIEHAYPDSNDPAGYFRINPFRLGDMIEGVTGNTTSVGRVLQLWAGAGCPRVFVG